MHARFGELLAKCVPLSKHDVNEILEEQQQTRRRFGQIALAWGLCEPTHVWRAWAEQAASNDGMAVDIRLVGIDGQLVKLLPHDVVLRLGAIPIRQFENQVIVAVAQALDESGLAELQRCLTSNLRFVRADASHIREAISQYYPAA